jgi:hypothetical protein
VYDAPEEMFTEVMDGFAPELVARAAAFLAHELLVAGGGLVLRMAVVQTRLEQRGWAGSPLHTVEHQKIATCTPSSYTPSLVVASRHYVVVVRVGVATTSSRSLAESV